MAFVETNINLSNMDEIDKKDQEALDQIEEKLLEKDRKKQEEKMIVEGRSVFDIQSRKHQDTSNKDTNKSK